MDRPARPGPRGRRSPDRQQVHQASTISSGLNAAFTAQLARARDRCSPKACEARAAAQRREATINPHVTRSRPDCCGRSTPTAGTSSGSNTSTAAPPTSAPARPTCPPSATCSPNSPASPRRVAHVNASKTAGQTPPTELVPTPSLLAGDHLLHTDLNPHNILITGTGPRIVDWSWPTLGAAWIDTACAALWLIAEGHTPADAESWAAGVTAWADATEPALNAFTTTNSALWSQIASTDPRPWKRSMYQAAVAWCQYRTTPRGAYQLPPNRKIQ